MSQAALARTPGTPMPSLHSRQLAQMKPGRDSTALELVQPQPRVQRRDHMGRGMVRSPPVIEGVSARRRGRGGQGVPRSKPVSLAAPQIALAGPWRRPRGIRQEILAERRAGATRGARARGGGSARLPGRSATRGRPEKRAGRVLGLAAPVFGGRSELTPQPKLACAGRRGRYFLRDSARRARRRPPPRPSPRFADRRGHPRLLCQRLRPCQAEECPLR